MTRFLVKLASLLVPTFFTHALELSQAVELPAGQHYEQCFHLNAQQSLDWRYSARQSLDFNIHYHDAARVHHAVRLKGPEHQGTYVAGTNQVYCVMWTNPHTGPSPMSYTLRIGPQP